MRWSGSIWPKARVASVAFVPAQVTGSTDALVEAMHESQELARSNTDELAMLKGLDPARVASVSAIAGDDAAVMAAVRKGLPLADLLILVAYRNPGVRAARGIMAGDGQSLRAGGLPRKPSRQLIADLSGNSIPGSAPRPTARWRQCRNLFLTCSTQGRGGAGRGGACA